MADCQDRQMDVQCIEADPKKAVELSIVILVDKEEECPPPVPPQQCPPPQPCQPCPLCMPLCCISPCQRRSICAPPGTALQVPPGTERAVSSAACCQTVSEAACQVDPYYAKKPKCSVPTRCCVVRCCATGVGVGSSAAGSQTQKGLQVNSTQSDKAGCKTTTSQTQKPFQRLKECVPKRPSSGEAPVTIPAEIPSEDIEKIYAPKAEAPAPAPARKCKKKHHHHHHHQHKHKRKMSKQRRHSVPADKLNFTECPELQMNFVQYFLKTEAGGPLVINLSETKLQYEKLCKQRLSKLQKHIRNNAQTFFLHVIDAINTTTPDTQHTEIKHYHVMKYLHPVLAALKVEADHDCNTIHKYQKYILSVSKVLEERLKTKQKINPTCLVEIETQIFAGMVSRFYPIFIKVKDQLLAVINTGKLHETLTPDEFIKQMRKLLLCGYVEIACIDNTFTNDLTSLSDLPNVEAQEKFRQELVLRRKHARHATKWAARCLATPILFYYLEHMEKLSNN